MKVIDVWSFVPDADSVRQVIAEWIDIPAYVRVFGPTLHALFELEKAEFAAMRRELTGATRALPVKPDVMRRWLNDNAARVLRIGDTAAVR